MSVNRKGENSPLPYRKDRFFMVDSEWYFTTREKLDHGPYSTRRKAELECEAYIFVCKHIDNPFIHADSDTH